MTDHSPRIGRWGWIVALLVGGGTLFLAWDRFGFGGHSALAGGQSLVDQAVGSSSLWTFADETDPMTDEQLISAKRQIEADGFLIDTAITCRPSSGTLTYTFTTFEADGTTPAEFREWTGGNSLYHNAEFRSDADAANVLHYSGPRFTNMFEVSDLGLDVTDVRFQRLGSAQRLTVKLQLQHGEPTFQIDQTDKILASIMEQCVQAQGTLREQQQTDRENLVADLEAQYRSLANIPAAQITDQQRRQLTEIRFRLAGLTGKQMPPPKADLEEAASRQESYHRQDQERADAQTAQAAEYEENKAQEHAQLCDSIRNTGAGNEEYRRAMGC